MILTNIAEMTPEKARADGVLLEALYDQIWAVTKAMSDATDRFSDGAVGLAVMNASNDMLRRGTQLQKEINALLEKHMHELEGGKVS